MPTRLVRDNRALVRTRLRQRGESLVRESAQACLAQADTLVPVDTAALKLTGRVEPLPPGLGRGPRWAVVYGGKSAAPVKVRSHDRGGQRIKGYVRSHPTKEVVVDYALFVETGPHAKPFLLPALAIVAARLRGQGYRLRVIYGGRN